MNISTSISKGLTYPYLNISMNKFVQNSMKLDTMLRSISWKVTQSLVSILYHNSLESMCACVSMYVHI